MRILVTGSRTWRNPVFIAEALDDRIEALPVGATLTVVVGYDPERQYPPGVDRFAYEYCESVAEFVERAGKTLAVDPHPARWSAPCRPECNHGPRLRNRNGEEYCKFAGFYRDAEMVRVVADARAAGEDGECLAFIEPCAKPRCRRRQPHGSHGATHTADLAEKAGIPTGRWTA